MIKTDRFTIRRSGERGKANHGWLDSRHTFSFANYYDAEHMGFRSLRVINEDKIAPGTGFPRHPHRDMEIFSYVLEGRLKHSDSMGNERILEPGQIQLMSAGSGVTHSEYNPSTTEPGHFLQIWIVPNRTGLTPSYTDWVASDAEKSLIISADGREGSATIAQDADVYRIKLDAGRSADHLLAATRGAWIQIVRGSAIVNGHTLDQGDAISTGETGLLTITAGDHGLEALLFDLA